MQDLPRGWTYNLSVLTFSPSPVSGMKSLRLASGETRYFGGELLVCDVTISIPSAHAVGEGRQKK